MAVHLRKGVPLMFFWKKTNCWHFNSSPYETSRKMNHSCGWWQQLGCPDGSWHAFTQIRVRFNGVLHRGRKEVDFPIPDGEAWLPSCLGPWIFKVQLNYTPDSGLPNLSRSRLMRAKHKMSLSKSAKDCAEYSMAQKQASKGSKNRIQGCISSCTIKNSCGTMQKADFLWNCFLSFVCVCVYITWCMVLKY
jgi:hypothetical protein